MAKSFSLLFAPIISMGKKCDQTDLYENVDGGELSISETANLTTCSCTTVSRVYRE